MKRPILFLVIIFIFSLSCSKKAIIRNYYLVELPKNIEIRPAAEMFPVTVDVRDFQVAKAFEQTRIALRTASNELNYFYYHHWAVRPSYALADQAYQTLDRLRLFRQVNRGFSYSPQYLVDGNVHSIERSHLDNQVSAHLSMSFQFIDKKTGLAVVRHEFDQLKKLDKTKHMNAFAMAVSEIFYQETLVFADKIKDYLAQENE